MKELSKIKDITEETIENLKTEFPVRERKNYHVALVKKTHNPRLEKYDISVMNQSYTDRSYPKLEDSLAYLGFSQAILLHDPRKEDLTVAPKETFEKRKESQEAMAEMQKKHDAEMAEMKKQLAAKNKNEEVVLEKMKYEFDLKDWADNAN
mgnify:CR=1 FL=1